MCTDRASSEWRLRKSDRRIRLAINKHICNISHPSLGEPNGAAICTVHRTEQLTASTGEGGVELSALPIMHAKAANDGNVLAENL